MNGDGPVSLLSSEPTKIADRHRGSRVGVLDIGSNSLRLVVYEGAGRAWFQMFNERGAAGLGSSLKLNGLLDENSVQSAIACLRRFIAIANEMGVSHLHAVATAAVRDASNGGDFVARVKTDLGLDIRVLSGEDEAKVAALGVLSGMPNAKGLVGDLGGGSLELVQIGDGTTGNYTTLPIGVLRFDELPNLDRAMVKRDLKHTISSVDWLKSMVGERLYLVGGSWRSLAKLHIQQSHYPMEIVHDYEVSPNDFIGFLSIVSKMSEAQLTDLRGVSKRRSVSLPIAALILMRVIKTVRPSSIVFSSYGLREGMVYELLPEKVRGLDPLLEGCAHLAHRYSRFDPNPETLAKWVEPVVGQGRVDRVIQAVCLFSDLGWIEHPSYRAEHAFLRALRMPVAGISHQERIFIGLALLARYAGTITSDMATEIRNLIPREKQEIALEVGLALRLGHTLSAGSTRLLDNARLHFDEDRVTLTLARPLHELQSDAVRKRLSEIAKKRELKHLITLSDAVTLQEQS